MTHLYCFLRGQDSQVFRFLQDCQGIYLDYNKTGKDGKKVLIGKLQLGVRPIQLYEFVFPEEHKDLVLKLLCPTGAWNTRYDKYINWIRKLLGLEKVDYKGKIEEAMVIRAMNMVDVVGVGMKKDKWKDGVELL